MSANYLIAALAAAPGASGVTPIAAPRPVRKSAGGTITSAAQPIAEPQVGDPLLRQALELYGQEDDFTAAQEFAKQRAAQGESALINALAANAAGSRFAPIQQMYLQRASAGQEPLKVGAATVAPDGTVMRDPSAERQRKADRYLQLWQYQTSLEDKQAARERDAALRAELAGVRAASAAGRSQDAAEARAFGQATRLRNELTQRLDKVAAGTGYAENVLTLLSDPDIARNPTKQVTLVTTFGKMLDPQSVVREAEYAMLANARGAFESVLQFPDRVASGAALTPQQLNSMREVARNLYAGSQQRQRDVLSFYRGIAERNNVPVSDVLPYGSPYDAASGAAPGGASGGSRRVRWEDLATESKE